MATLLFENIWHAASKEHNSTIPLGKSSFEEKGDQEAPESRVKGKLFLTQNGQEFLIMTSVQLTKDNYTADQNLTACEGLGHVPKEPTL